MTTEGCDFSYGRPGGAAIAATGRTFVVRYVPYGGLAKGLTAAEVTDYHANGLGICLVWESTAGRALAGASAGIADATTAKAAAAGLGFPDSLPIYFAVDFDATAAQQPVIDAYLGGAGSVLGPDRVGVYGGYGVVTRCQGSRTARWYWQTYAWSYGKVAAGIHLYQYLNGQVINGGTVDFDRAMQAQFGQWEADMTPHTKHAASLGTTTINGTGHYLINTSDTSVRYGPRAAGEQLIVAASLDLVDGAGKPIDIDGHQPPVGNRDEVYLVDATAFGGAAYALRADCTPLVVPADATPYSQADLDAAAATARKNGYNSGVAAVQTAANAVKPV